MYSFINLLIFTSLLGLQSSPQKGAIVFLRGPCSVGKSSICKALSEADKSWKSIDEDEYHIRLALHAIKKEFPLQFTAIKKSIRKCNRYHALQRKEIFFKEATRDEKKQSALKSIDYIRNALASNPHYSDFRAQIDRITRDKLINDIKKYASKGYNVIVDSWFLKEEDFQIFKKKFPFFLGIAYAPLHVLLERVNKRNRTAYETKNLMSKRFIRQALESFNQTYTLTSNPTPIVLDTLSKETLIACLENIRSQLLAKNEQAHQHSFKEFTTEELDEFKEKMLARFNGEPKVNITLDQKYDFVINTKENKPEFYAQLIKRKVESQIS